MSSISPFHQIQQKSKIQPNLSLQKPNHKVTFLFKDKNHPIQNKQKGIIKKIMQNMAFQILITIVTIASLFLQDLRTIFITIDYDPIVDSIHLTFLGIFLIQVGMSMTIEGYPFSFFFFLDIISTLSIALDVSFVTDLIYQTNTSSRAQLNQIIIQSKASRAAARAVRVMKIFRLTRVVKLYKTALKTQQISQQKKKNLLKMKMKQNKNNKNILGSIIQIGNVSRVSSHEHNMLGLQNPNDASAHQLNISFKQSNKQQKQQKSKGQQQAQKQQAEDKQQQKPQSKISKVLSQTTIKKIIIVILLIMLSVPILQSSNYFTEDKAWAVNVNYLYRLINNTNINITFINYTVNRSLTLTIQKAQNFELIGFLSPYDQILSYNYSDINNQRVNDIGVFQQTLNLTQINFIRTNLTRNQNDQAFTLIVTYKKFNQIDSWFSIGKILFLCIALLYLLNSFNNKISEMIVQPIQQMMQTVKKSNNIQKVEDEEDNNYQTAIVHNSILKIRGLMGMFFGQLGAKLIYSHIFDQNVNKRNFLQHKQKRFGIYGIIKIKNFFQISRILDQNVIALANDISNVIHSSVYRYGGSAVKNLTDGYIISWHLPEQQQKNIKNINFTDGKQRYVNVFADYALYSLIKIIVKINKQTKFLKYRKDQKLAIIDSNFQVQVNCALSVGYSCEGLIGSYFKLDTMHSGGKMNQIEKISLLSTNFDLGILLDGDLVATLTNSMKKFCRIVDRIKFTQYDNIVSLYTVDLDLQNISPPRNKFQKYKNIEDRPDVHLKRQINMQFLKDQVQINNYNALAFANSKKQLREVLKNGISQQAKQRYSLAFNLYISGDWTQAKSHLLQLMKIKKQDKLTQRIYYYIQKFNFISPNNWNKCRNIYQQIQLK